MTIALRSALLLATSTLAVLAPRTARADPQGTVGLTVGAAGVGLDRAVWDTTVFHLGARGDVLFGRDGNDDFGVGPYAEVLTHAFDEMQVGGGVSALVPVIEALPLVLSAGMYGRQGNEGFGLEPGAAGALFWGTRSYNYHGGYGMAAGLLLEGRWGLGSSRETSIVIGAQLDLYVLSLPVVLLINAVQGGSSETAPVR
jgi:hypothetical protein